MPAELFRLAEKEGIVVAYHDFVPPIEAVYLTLRNGQPIIGLASWLDERTPHFRCVFAEELGHHFACASSSEEYFHIRKFRIQIAKAEYKARKWAALFLIPPSELLEAIEKGIVESYDLADHFNVTHEFLLFRLSLHDARNMLWNQMGA